jgi:hypothetical protein
MEEPQWVMRGLVDRQLEDPNLCPGEKMLLEIIN